MKNKTIVIAVILLAALGAALTVGCQASDEPADGGADTAAPKGQMTYSLPSNPTTGYDWTAFVLGGSSVKIDDSEGEYVQAPNTDDMVGVGGTQHFTLDAVEAGDSIVRFVYSRGFEATIEQEIILLVSVDDDLTIHAQELTDGGSYDGVVTSVDAAEHSVTLSTESMGEVVACFNEDTELPAADEHIMVYTNGTVTMSLPPIVNVIAWESIPPENASG